MTAPDTVTIQVRLRWETLEAYRKARMVPNEAVSALARALERYADEEREPQGRLEL
jgi:hypothetical protein